MFSLKRYQTDFLVSFKSVNSILKESSWIPLHYSHVVDHAKRLRTIWQTFCVSWFHARQSKSNYCGISFYRKMESSHLMWGLGGAQGVSLLSLLVFGGAWFFSEEVCLLDIDQEKSTQEIICVLWTFFPEQAYVLFLIFSRVRLRRQTGFWEPFCTIDTNKGISW